MRLENTRQVPPPCNEEVFRDGISLMLCVTESAMSFDEWIKDIATRSGQRVDWHYVAGRAHVLYIGDRNAITEAIYHNPPPGGASNIAYWSEGGPYLPAGAICWVHHDLSSIIEVATTDDSNLAEIPRDSKVHIRGEKAYSYSREMLRAHAINALFATLREKRKELGRLEALIADRRSAIATYESALENMTYGDPFVDANG